MPRISRRTLVARAVTALAVLPLLAARAQAATHQVAIRGMAFRPNARVIAAGDTVVFTNEDGAPHTATADSGAFDTGRLSQSRSAQLTFSSAAVYPYHCEVHRSMTATITVT